MTVHSLRRILTLQPILAMLLPFGVAALIGLFWVLPQIRSDAESRQLQIARAVGSQVESYLDTSIAIVTAAAAIPHDRDMTQHYRQLLLDALLTSTESLSSLYVVNPAGKVSVVSLNRGARKQRQDLTNLDLSRNTLFRDVLQSKKPRWSDVFLSAINGGLSAAYAVPRDGAVVIGEVDLGRLTKFLKQISGGNDLLIMIVDHKGQVIADHDGRYTAQQLNIGNIPMVRSGIETDLPTTDRFEFSGESMTGSIIQIPAVDWHVLVAQKDVSLYRTVLNIAWTVLACILTALFCAVAASIYLAGKLAARFDALAGHAQDIAQGNRSGAWPMTYIAEFNLLSGSLQFMGDTLHQQELVLRESEERFRTLVEQGADGFELLDSEGRFVDMNSTTCRLHGYSREELLGMSIADIDTMITREQFISFFELLKGTPPQTFEKIHRRKDGTTFPVEINVSAILLAGKTFALSLVRDITERKRAEDERQYLEQQLLHSQKLESLGVLAGGIAHDFNNILTAIIGNADLALMRLNKESPAVDNLQRIEQAAARAADLARQMLAYSGKGRFVIESLDMNRLLEEMLQMLEVSISKKAALRLNLTSSLPTVEADATQMRQIIMNLVINASEAIGDNSGVIAVTTGCMDCERNYLKDVWLDENLSEGRYVYLEIADSGCGMERETLAKIFDPFFTTKFTGRGLGMAAVLGIVRGHRGAIKVYSELGRGSRFKILLPASNRPAEISRGETHEDDWRGSGTVLLVDDEETVRDIGTEMLKELGFTVITAGDGRQALEIFQATAGISFVLLDLTMPHMDGEQTFRELRRLKPDVRVIMSSGYNEQEVTRKFVGKGLAGFIQKPYRLSVLRDAVLKAISGPFR